VADLRDPVALWTLDLHAGTRFINSGGCIAVHLNDDDAGFDGVLQLLRQSGRAWKFHPIAGRIAWFQEGS